MCVAIAPLIIPMAINAPYMYVVRISYKITAISFAIPVPIFPQGSMPTLVKIYIVSSALGNLKYKVCSIIMAVKILQIQISIIYIFI